MSWGELRLNALSKKCDRNCSIIARVETVHGQEPKGIQMIFLEITAQRKKKKKGKCSV